MYFLSALVLFVGASVSFGCDKHAHKDSHVILDGAGAKSARHFVVREFSPAFVKKHRVRLTKQFGANAVFCNISHGRVALACQAYTQEVKEQAGASSGQVAIPCMDLSARTLWCCNGNVGTALPFTNTAPCFTDAEKPNTIVEN